MTIASAITAAQGRVADCYTAISNKGGTLPATQNLANMPTAIGSIPSGSSGYTEIPSYQVVNGVASRRSGTLTGNEFSDITSVDVDGLYFAFYNCSGLTGTLDLSSLTSIGRRGLSNAFYSCWLTSVDLSSLASVGQQGLASAFHTCLGLTGTLDLSSLISVGNSGMASAFYNCSGLTGTLDLSSLTSIESSGLSNAFYGCSGLTNVNLSSLTSIGSAGFVGAFQKCAGLTDIYFNSLTTTSFGNYINQFNNMFDSSITSGICTVHLPSNLESTIQGLTGYPNFGGTSSHIVLSFDLPATS